MVHNELSKPQVAIIGATTWGTTLGIILAQREIPVVILVRTSQEAKELDGSREHRRFLPGIPFPACLSICSNADKALVSVQLVIIAVPSSSFRQNIRRIRNSIPPGSIILSATKGLEYSGLRMSQILEQELPAHLHSGICVLSGPNLAKEIVTGKPASTTIAGRNLTKAQEAQALVMCNILRVYTSDDVIGVELGGALKNIIALGAGIGDGLKLGDNARAAFITRGLAEITRLGIAAGAHPLTFAGLAGLGDLIATCSSTLSRNHYVGEQLAFGKSWPEIQRSMVNVAEGVSTTKAALEMAARLGIEMPIAEATHRILFEGLSPRQALEELLSRPPRPEWS